jgi:hypothetical protein
MEHTAERLRTEFGASEELAAALDDHTLAHLAAVLADETRSRAVDTGDADAIIADAFETGFGRDGLAVSPWIVGGFVVCPGGLVATSRGSHRCRFVSVDDTWIWDSPELVREDKRSIPGAKDGFRAVALLAPVQGLKLDVVSGRARRGEHRVERVVSLELRDGDLVEVAQRTVGPLQHA